MSEAKRSETDTVLPKRNSGSEAGGTKKLHKYCGEKVAFRRNEQE
ncbi:MULTISPECIES: hypothetical protein [Methanosarcina]|nr:MULTISPECIES: hypothetical protein [Methanosarcina]